MVTDPSFERTFYKLAGFRFLGKRAVRIDILERLADLIRPLLQWKPGTTPRPDGAYDGRRFTATTAMLSILGATPDDMEEILKGLGYRADAVKVEDAAAFLAAQSGSAAPATDATASDTPAETADHDDADAAPAGDEVQASEPAASETATAEQAVETVPAAAEAEASDQAVIAEQAGELAEPVEAKPVLLWRPGSRNDNQRSGGRPQGDRRGAGNRAPQGEARREGGEPRREGEGRREGRDDSRKPGGGGKPDRNRGRDGGKPQGGQRHEKGDRQDRPDRNDRGGKPQAAKFEARPPRKEKPIDPDSPFAKLAALKEQMKK